jgi:hypothetical protein
VVLLDIDGLRSDVFQGALAAGTIPNLARLLGGPEASRGLVYQAAANAPSITYSCQASTVTGAHPAQHGIAGNMFFDRFGRLTGGKPRFYQFDFTDAPAVIAQGLASKVLARETETLFETAARHKVRSTVAYHMYARGAKDWLKPGLDDWALFAQVKQPNFSELYDEHMLKDVMAHLQSGERPGVLLLYFFGMDHESHLHGPGVQSTYLRVIDRQVGEFLKVYEDLGLFEETVFCIFSDHGHIEIVADDVHALKVGMLFDREMGLVFQALGLDVNDHLLEQDFNALLAQAGGMAQIYVRRTGKGWDQAPAFSDVLRVAQAFWQANEDGAYSADLKGSLELILVRNCEAFGWLAEYEVFRPEGVISVADYLSAHPALDLVDAENRFRHMAGPMTGDVLLLANASQGYSFTLLPYKGMHGGLHPEDSNAVLAYGWPSAPAEQANALWAEVREAIAARCAAEGQRKVSNVDVAFGVRKLMGWG